MTEQRARELLAEAFEADHLFGVAAWIRTDPRLKNTTHGPAIQAITAALAESAKSPSDSVRRLVITARELLDESDDASDAARALDRALEDFAGAVPFADESNDIRALRKAAPPPAIAEAAFTALDGSAVTRLLTKFAQAADFSNARDCQIYGALLAYSDARAALQSSEADNG